MNKVQLMIDLAISLWWLGAAAGLTGLIYRDWASRQ